MTFTAGQRKFLVAVAKGEHASFHVRVTKPVFDAGYVFPRHGALFPWIVGCNGQVSTDYFLTSEGARALGLEPIAA